MFEFHTYLHHSQTACEFSYPVDLFEFHTYLHHSQTQGVPEAPVKKFEFHTYLHHSQTAIYTYQAISSLSSIHIYIILKRLPDLIKREFRLSSIHIYIILKRYCSILL